SGSSGDSLLKHPAAGPVGGGIHYISIGVDRKHKLIRKLVTDTASVHDSRHFEVVLDDWNTSAEVYADRGYPSQEREEQLKAQGYRSRIQRKGSRNHPLSECQQRRNHKIAKVRARVEHVFGTMEQMGGKCIRTIGQARADFALTMMAVTYNIKRLGFLEVGPMRAVACP
ncbi:MULTISPECIES: transposase, partial [Acidithiobacillus]